MSAQISTIVTLAARETNYGGKYPHGSRLKRLGLKTFENVIDSSLKSGIQILFGSKSEIDDDRFLPEIKLSISSHGTIADVSDRSENFVNLNPSTATNTMAGYAYPTSDIGGHYLWVYLPNQNRPLLFNIVTFPNRITTIVFEKETDSPLRVYQYAPSIHSDMYSSELSDLMDLRRYELIQRFLRV